jgi:hypothetical protein
VAAGTYKPKYAPGSTGESISDSALAVNSLTVRDKTFILREGVELRGGYIATGEPTISEAVRKARFNADGTPINEDYQATLSGDIDNNDISGIAGSNAYHVVMGVDIPNDGKTILDGFTIKGGSANTLGSISVNDKTVNRNYGGGMYNYNSSPVLTNVTIAENNTSNGGGGMHNSSSSSPTLINVTIAGNNTGGDGGGMSNNSNSSPILTNVIIAGNNAVNGGGMSNSTSSPILTNVTIGGNNTTGLAGGMYNYNSSPVLTNVTILGNSAGGYGGGMLNSSSSPVLTNVTIAGNSATGNGGGIVNAAASPVLINVTIAGNKAGSAGGIYNYSNASPKIRNSIIWGNSSGITTESGSSEVSHNSIVQEGGYPESIPISDSSFNLTANPQFVSPELPTSAPNTDGDYSLQDTSPAIDAGDNDYYPNTWTKWQSIQTLIGKTILTQTQYNAYVLPALSKDAGGADRFKPLNGIIDMGAYENQQQ